jgi:hypothetical protein
VKRGMSAGEAQAKAYELGIEPLNAAEGAIHDAYKEQAAVPG